MAQFLSPAWFAQLEATTAPGRPAGDAGSPELVIEVNVAGGPEAPAAGAQDGTAPVCYQVALWAEGARVLYGPEGNLEADVRLSVDYQTLAAVASGVMPPLEAMFSGRARIAGGTTALSAHQSALEPLDLVPAAVRASTTF